MKKVIILHAWYNKPDTNWYPWLKKELEKRNYNAFIPDLPTMQTDLPDLDILMKTVYGLIDQNTILVGHSLTCLLSMRIAEKMKYQKMILVAGWDFDDLTEGHKLFWPDKIKHEIIKQNVSERYIIHSDNDPYITSYSAKEMAKRLDGEFILVKGAGHFTNKDGIEKLPQILPLF